MKKTLVIALSLTLAVIFVSCSTESIQNVNNSTQSQNTNTGNSGNAEKNVSTNLEAEMDKPISSIQCARPYDASNTAHKFACEYEQSLLKFAPNNAANIKDSYGNWFGRVVGFGYKINTAGTDLYEEKNDGNGNNQDPFRDLLRNKTIKFTTYQTNFNNVNEVDDGDNNPNTKTFTAEVEIEAVGLNYMGRPLPKGIYTVTYKVKNAGWEAQRVEIQ